MWKVAIPAPADREGLYGKLREAGCELLLGKSADEYPEWVYSDADLAEMCLDADAMIVHTRERVTREVMKQCKKLRVVTKPSIGTERIDVQAATELGILVTHAPVPENYLSLAEATIGLMLDLMKRTKQKEANLRAGNWRRGTGGDMVIGKTLGIVGLGRIGYNVALRLQNWGVKILAYDPYVSPDTAREVGAELTELDSLLKNSDVVTLHVVITPETQGMIGARELGLMKPTAYLINTCRGDAVDEPALTRALKEKRIAGAALDVFWQEPINMDNPLLELDNVIVTPHSISHSRASSIACLRAAVADVVAGLQGESPQYPKNPEVLPRWRERIAAMDAAVAAGR